jgi:hypothetical protein
MTRRLVVCLALGIPAATGWGAAAPKTRPAEVATADTSKVMVIVTPPAGGPKGIKDRVEEAMTRKRMVTEPMGGLKCLLAKNPKDAPKEATEENAGSLLQVQVTNRTMDMVISMYTLSVKYTVFVPAGKSWKQVATGTETTSGSERDIGGLRVSDCDNMADSLGRALIAKLFPYQLVKGDGATIEVKFKNTSLRSITKLTLRAPDAKRNIWLTHTEATVQIEPGEKKTVSFKLPADKGSANWQQAAITEIAFE